jgi:hypothetical protein
VVGSRAMYELSHILAEFNKGWEPNWSDNNLRWSIVTFANSLTVFCMYTLCGSQHLGSEASFSTCVSDKISTGGTLKLQSNSLLNT